MLAQNGNGNESYTAKLSQEIDAAYEANRPGPGESFEKLQNALYKPFQAQARDIVRWRLRTDDEELATDITHRALMALESFHGDCRLSTWFYRIAKNEVNRGLKRRIQERKRFVSIDSGDDEVQVVLQLEAALVDPDASLDRAKALRSLSSEHAEVIRLKEEGHTLAEIAEQTGTPIGTVRSRYDRAKKKLAKAGI